jgi:hypothetical protein
MIRYCYECMHGIGNPIRDFMMPPRLRLGTHSWQRRG